MTFRCILTGMVLSGILAVSALAGAADDVILFDFENPTQLDLLTTNTPATLSTDWASQGAKSLKVEFEAHVAGETPDFPHVACWADKIPVRDWREYRYYCFDICTPADGTYVGVIVQRSGKRADRMDRRYSFPKGAHRMWVNIENFVAKEGDLETVSNIVELEFFQSKPPRAGVLFLDNIRLLKSYDGESGADSALWVDTLTGLAASPPVDDSKGPVIDRAENLAVSDADLLARHAEALSAIARAVQDRAAADTLATAIETHFEKSGYGGMVAPVGDHVFFSGQAVQPSWSHTLDLDVLRGETRSRQLVIFPKPGETLEDVRVVAGALSDSDGNRIDADRISLELVGYVHLGESAMHQFRGFTDFGWYPDPILSLTKPFDVAPPRQLQPVLVTVRVPRDIPAGQYAGRIAVSAADRGPLAVDVALTVHDAVMPVTPRLPHLIHCGMEGFSPEFRLNPNNGDLGSIYRWGSAVEPDTIAQHVEAGMNRYNLLRISQFNLAGRCAKRGEEAGARQFVDMVTNLYTDDVMTALAERELLDKAVFYGFDEVHTDDPKWQQRITNVFGPLKERYGKYGVKTATTARPWATPEAWDLPVDIWIPLLREYDPVLAGLARERSMEVWWYSIGWEIYQAPLWSNALCWAGYANKVDGWLYYHMYDWVNRNQRLTDENPLTSWSPLSEGSRGSFGTGAVVYFDANGDPQPSLRLVNLREGMFDYDLLCLLRDKVEEVEKAAPAEDFELQVTLSRARDFLDAPWRSAMTDYVLKPTREGGAVAGAGTRELRAQALELLDGLDRRGTSGGAE
ncbi:MAG: DUF4091 domain-containing protein [bacterium]|nr:DUF4091 domain-containing protein [bacterium]